MRMTLAMLGLAMLVNVAAYGQTEAVAPDWVFISKPLKWESPPPNAELHIRIAPATLLGVYPSGKYAAMSCLLIKQKDGAVTISHGDGYVVRSGAWKMSGDKLIAKASVVFRTVSLIGKSEPEPTETEQFKIDRVSGHKELHDLGGPKYAPLPQFADVNNLAAIINTRAAQPLSPQ